MKDIILLSGGFDSVVLSHHIIKENLSDDLLAIFFDYGQPNLAMERKCAEKACESLKINLKVIKIEDMSWVKGGFFDRKGEEDFYVEWRNLIFLSYALSIAESIKAKKIYVGFIYTKHPYSDADPSFLRKFGRIAKISGVKISAPFKYLTKPDLKREAEKYRVKYEDIFSCNVPNDDGSPCGKCGDCIEVSKVYND